MQVDHVESFTKNTNVHVNPIINMYSTASQDIHYRLRLQFEFTTSQTSTCGVTIILSC